jgi:hypothetical protein
MFAWGSDCQLKRRNTPVAIVTLVKTIGSFRKGKIISMEKRSPKKEAAIVKALQCIKGEIRHYPTPIAHCDEQFNFLLSERDRLSKELNKLQN